MLVEERLCDLNIVKHHGGVELCGVLKQIIEVIGEIRADEDAALEGFNTMGTA